MNDIAEQVLYELGQLELPNNDSALRFANALESWIRSVEVRLAGAQQNAARAANIASCLANGIIPD